MIHARVCVTSHTYEKFVVDFIKNQKSICDASMNFIWCLVCVCACRPKCYTKSICMHVHIANEKLENLNVNARTWTHQQLNGFYSVWLFPSKAVAISFDTLISDLGSASPWTDSIRTNMLESHVQMPFFTHTNDACFDVWTNLLFG